MGAETVGTLVVAGVIVAAIALYLIGITLNLRRTSLALRRVRHGVVAIHKQTEPIGGVLGEIAAETGAIASALTALVQPAVEARQNAADVMHGAVERARSGDGAPTMPTPEPAGSMREAVSLARMATVPVDMTEKSVVVSVEPEPDSSRRGPAARRRRRPASAQRPSPSTPRKKQAVDLAALSTDRPDGDSMSAAVARARQALATQGG